MTLSIVTTMYHSSLYVDEFYDRITAEAQTITDDYEIIFVDDGSPDDSLQKAIKLYKKDKKVKVIELSRNFGHHKAIMTGLSHAKGEFVFLIDVDLEEEPELLGRFWEELQSGEDLDVVYGVQESRKGRWFERWSGRIYYQVFNYLVDEGKIAKNILAVRLMKNNYIKNLLAFKEKEFFFAPICEMTGFNQKDLKIKKHSTSPTTYTFWHKYNLLINSIFTFSIKPLYFMFYLGNIITFISFIYIINIVIKKLIFDVNIAGWTSLIASIWFLGGLIILFLGTISIYISKIFIETKNRPFAIIKKIYEGKK
jgi:putative glycosyltransferase